jgi:hypothetical protein
MLGGTTRPEVHAMRVLACSMHVLGVLALVQAPAMAAGGRSGQVAQISASAGAAKQDGRPVITAQVGR